MSTETSTGPAPQGTAPPTPPTKAVVQPADRIFAGTATGAVILILVVLAGWRRSC